MRLRLSARFETWYVAAVITPIAILAALLSYGFIQQFQSLGRVQMKLADLVSQDHPIDNASLARLHRKQTSTEQTSDLMRIMLASRALNHRIDNRVEEFENLKPGGSAWAAEPYYEQIADDNHAITEAVESLGQEDKPIWVPIQYQGVATLLPEVQQAREVFRRCAETYRYQFHQGKYDDAIDTLKAQEKLADQFGGGHFVVSVLVRIAMHEVRYQQIRQSLGHTGWNADQLETLQAMLAERPSEDQDWSKMVYSEQAMFLSEMGVAASSKKYGLIGNTMGQVIPAVVAPRSAEQYLQMSDAMAALESQTAWERARLRSSDEPYQHLFAQESITSLPFSVCPALWTFSPAWEAVASAFARLEMDRRFTRTAVALKRYDLQKERWPNSLSELSEVGLPDGESEFAKGNRFGYRIDEANNNEVRLWKPILAHQWNPSSWSETTVPTETNYINHPDQYIVRIRGQAK